MHLGKPDVVALNAMAAGAQRIFLGANCRIALDVLRLRAQGVFLN